MHALVFLWQLRAFSVVAAVKVLTYGVETVQVVEDVGAAVDGRGERTAVRGEVDRFGHLGVSVQRRVLRRGELEVASWDGLVDGVVKVVSTLPCVRASQFASMVGLGRPTYWRCEASDTMYRVPLG